MIQRMLYVDHVPGICGIYIITGRQLRLPGCITHSGVVNETTLLDRDYMFC